MIDQNFKKIQSILEEAKNNVDFHDKYQNNTVGTGERSVDYVIYQIEISKDVYLLVDFVDFGLDSYSIIDTRMKKTIDFILG